MSASTVDPERGTNATDQAIPSILIVEDEVIVAEDVRRRLEEMGYRVTGVASRGDLALEHVRRVRPDLILMDIGLKGDVDGIEAAKAILTEEDIPIVFASAYSDDVTLRRVKTIKPFGFVLKPFDERELRTAIEIGLYKHQTERALRERELVYRSLVELSPDGIATLDLNGTITFCNAHKAMMHGFTSPEALIGRHALELVAEEDRDHAKEVLARVLRGDPLTDELITFSRNNGDPVMAEVSAMLIMGSGSRATQVMCVEHDVTHRLQTEADLRLAVQQLQFVVENLDEGIMFEDHTGRVQLTNSAFRGMFGLNAGVTAQGTPGAEIVRETSLVVTDGPSFLQRIEEVRSAAIPVHGDVLRLKDGRSAQRDYAPLQVDGTLLGHVWHYHVLP